MISLDLERVRALGNRVLMLPTCAAQNNRATRVVVFDISDISQRCRPMFAAVKSVVVVGSVIPTTHEHVGPSSERDKFQLSDAD